MNRAAPAPANLPQGVTQQDLITALTKLGQAKGRDAIAGLFSLMGVQNAGQIKPGQYDDVVAQVAKLLA